MSASAWIGSITPCGNVGAEPTTTTVSAVTAAAIASTSARKSGVDRDAPQLEPKYWRRLVERRVRGDRRTISGSVMPALARAVPVGLHRQQDALGAAGGDRADHRASGSAWPAPSMDAVIATISASNFVALGHRSGCSGLLCECAV